MHERMQIRVPAESPSKALRYYSRAANMGSTAH